MTGLLGLLLLGHLHREVFHLSGTCSADELILQMSTYVHIEGGERRASVILTHLKTTNDLLCHQPFNMELANFTDNEKTATLGSEGWGSENAMERLGKSTQGGQQVRQYSRPCSSQGTELTGNNDHSHEIHTHMSNGRQYHRAPQPSTNKNPGDTRI